MYFVYAIKSIEHNYIYVGISDNPTRRIEQHNKGQNKSTKPYLPFQTILIEECLDRPSARIKEKYFKGTSGKRYLKTLVN